MVSRKASKKAHHDSQTLNLEAEDYIRFHSSAKNRSRVHQNWMAEVFPIFNCPVEVSAFPLPS